MYLLNLLCVPVIFWLLPVWCTVARYCELIALRKNLSACEWFFRGMCLNLIALSEIVSEPDAPAEHKFKAQIDDSLKLEATKELLSALLVLVGIPFYSILAMTLFSVVWRFLEGRAFPACFGIYCLFQCLMWFPLLWLICFLASGPLARYKGVCAGRWTWLSLIGMEISGWILLRCQAEDDSAAKKERFLEDELTGSLVDCLMTAITVPGRILAGAALIGILAFLIACVFNPPIKYGIGYPRDFVLAVLAFFTCFTGWLLPACCSWSLAKARGLDRMKWTLAGFFGAGIAPLLLCFARSQLPDSPRRIFSPDPVINDILSAFVTYAQIPWSALVCFAFGATLAWDQNPVLFSGSSPSLPLSIIAFFCLGQFFYCPVLAILFFLARGRRSFSEVLEGGAARTGLTLALIHLLCLTLWICYGLFVVARFAGNMP